MIQDVIIYLQEFSSSMFPQGFTYNPGVVLDPVTMTPMITHGGNITVNPVGVPMRPEQKVWQKMFIKNIPQECSNESMQRLLNEFGSIKNFKRSLDNRGKLLPFCHFDLETGTEIIRIRRLFINIKMLDRILELKISPQTQTFIKEWMTMQKQQWRKKLTSPGMNEAKEYDSLEAYHIRDDKKYKQKIDETLKQINAEVKKIAIERMREEQRRQHPKEKQREKAKKRAHQELQRNFHQKEEHWLKREREKQREQRKQREREREREKQRARRLEKQLAIDDEEVEKRVSRFLTEERRKFLQKEEEEDVEIMMEENPPLPQQQIEQQPAPIKKVKIIAEEQIQLGAEKVEEVLVEAPKIEEEPEKKVKQLQKNELFQGYEKIYEVEEEEKPIQLNIPQLPQLQVDEEEQKKLLQKIAELQAQVPKNKMDLWAFPINWEKLAKSVVLERYIRPWLEEMSNEYMGGVEEKFIALVQKKLLSKSHPDKIIKILKQLLDQDSEEFVIKLWKKLALEYLKLENDLV